MSLTTDIQTGLIVQDDGICGGKPRIAGTRIKVQHIAIEYDRLGLSPDHICDSHSGLTLAKVHAAISYYYSHKSEIDLAIHEDEEFVEKLRRGLS